MSCHPRMLKQQSAQIPQLLSCDPMPTPPPCAPVGGSAGFAAVPQAPAQAPPPVNVPVLPPQQKSGTTLSKQRWRRLRRGRIYIKLLGDNIRMWFAIMLLLAAISYFLNYICVGRIKKGAVLDFFLVEVQGSRHIFSNLGPKYWLSSSGAEGPHLNALHTQGHFIGHP